MTFFKLLFFTFHKHKCLSTNIYDFEYALIVCQQMNTIHRCKYILYKPNKYKSAMSLLQETILCVGLDVGGSSPTNIMFFYLEFHLFYHFKIL